LDRRRGAGLRSRRSGRDADQASLAAQGTDAEFEIRNGHIWTVREGVAVSLRGFLAAASVVASVAVVGAETWGHRQLKKRDERRSPPPDAPKE
jgi:hypothetical protein